MEEHRPKTDYIIFEATQVGPNWIQLVSEALQIDENEPDNLIISIPGGEEPTEQETAGFFVSQNPNGGPPWITMTIGRSIKRDRFIVSLRIEEGGKQQAFSHRNIGQLGINLTTHSIDFIPVSVDKSSQEPIVTINSTGVITPTLTELSVNV